MCLQVFLPNVLFKHKTEAALCVQGISQSPSRDGNSLTGFTRGMPSNQVTLTEILRLLRNMSYVCL